MVIFLAKSNQLSAGFFGSRVLMEIIALIVILYVVVLPHKGIHVVHLNLIFQLCTT